MNSESVHTWNVKVSDFETIDLAKYNLGDYFRVREWEVRDDDEPAFFMRFVRPFAHRPNCRIANVAPR